MNEKIKRKHRLRAIKEGVSQDKIVERALKMYLLTKPIDEKGRIKIRNYIRNFNK